MLTLVLARRRCATRSTRRRRGGDRLAKRVAQSPTGTPGANLAGDRVDERQNGRLFGVRPSRTALAMRGGSSGRHRSTSRRPRWCLASIDQLVLAAHRLTDAVEHVPCRLGGDAVLALDLASPHPVLARRSCRRSPAPRSGPAPWSCASSSSVSTENCFLAGAALPDPALAHGASRRSSGSPRWREEIR